MNTFLNLLVVEHDPNIRGIIEVSLGLDPRIAVRTAESGAEAFAIVTSGIIPFDVVLLDSMLPDMPGLQLVEALAATPKYGRLPIVILAASRHGELPDRYESAGVLAVMAKPFDPLALAPDIRAHLARQ